MNTLTHVGNLFAFIGGLGMFLYGMDIMASGLQKTAGNKMKDLLGYLTNNRILGVLVGALVTAIIQSSSATTVMVVGFVNAGIMNLTTITAFSYTHLGGTNLNTGADCSGFVKSVYKSFGYNLPRSSSSQRSAGRKVSYSNKQPGDLICYSGHRCV